MDPLRLRSEDASVGHCVLTVWLDLKKLVCCAELAPVFAGAVTNDDLRGVLVGHDDSCLGQTRSEGSWVVGLKGLFDHACVEVAALLVHSPFVSYEVEELTWTKSRFQRIS